MHKKPIKAVALIASTLLIIGLLAGCGAGALTRQPIPSTTASPAQPVKITGKCDMTIEGNKAKLHCTTDVMDGAIFKLSLTSAEGKPLNSTVVAKNGDNLNAEFDLTNIKDNPIYGFAICAPDANGKQPDAVTAKYGNKFQFLESDALMWTLDVNMLVFPSGEVKRG